MKKLICLVVLLLAYSICYGEVSEKELFTQAVGLGAEGKFEEAKQKLEEILQLNLFSTLAKSNLQIIEDLSSQKIDNETALAIFKGLDYNERQMYNEAMAEFNKAIDRNPTYTKSIYCRAGTYVNTFKFDEAITDFNQVLKLDPQDVWSYVFRGLILQAKGMSSEALADYNKAIELNPKEVDAYVNRGSLYQSMGKIEQAISDFTEALKINPKDFEVQYAQGLLYNQTNQYEKALADFNKVIEIKPEYVDAYLQKGVAFEGLGRVKESIEAYEGFIQHADPRDRRITMVQERIEKKLKNMAGKQKPQETPVASTEAERYYNEGVTYLKANQFDEAIKSFEKTISVDSDSKKTFTDYAYCNIGYIYNQQSQFEKALGSLNKALEINPEDAQAYYSLGDVYLSLDNKDKAKESYKKASELFEKQGETTKARLAVVKMLQAMGQKVYIKP